MCCWVVAFPVFSSTLFCASIEKKEEEEEDGADGGGWIGPIGFPRRWGFLPHLFGLFRFHHFHSLRYRLLQQRQGRLLIPHTIPGPRSSFLIQFFYCSNLFSGLFCILDSDYELRTISITITGLGFGFFPPSHPSLC
ncbi:hypothetical protein RJT34_07082 [Clitoria ternatea]|uniref:Secreted protein n=1 Tax=Clitoria ternatea TaxID=43366 RepID=A0AAN9PTC8_CLITE